MQPPRFPVQLVTINAAHRFAEHDALDKMRALGFEVTGEHHSEHTREELQGAPIFRGLFGPFWADGMYRYEDAEANEFYST